MTTDSKAETAPFPATAETLPEQDCSNTLISSSFRIDEQEDPERFDHFRVLERLGAGANGRVFKAQDEELGREVAIKWLLTSEDGSARERFRREARAMAALRHEHVAEVYTTGELEGRPYMVMELLSSDLRTELEATGPLSAERAMEVLEQAAAGLGCAAQAGIIHRDVKPANLLREAGSGRIAVADFGLARFEDLDSSLTATGWVTGTPYYVAPEVIEEGRSDVRSDIYSLGATMYHLLAGAPPFEGATPAATLIAHVSKPVPDLAAARPELPAPLVALVQRCLAKDPAERFEGYDALLAALARARAGEAVPAPAQRPDEARGERLRIRLEERRILVSPRRARLTIGPRPRPGGRGRIFGARLLDGLRWHLQAGVLAWLALDLCGGSWGMAGLLAFGLTSALAALGDALRRASVTERLLGLTLTAADGDEAGRRAALLARLALSPWRWAGAPALLSALAGAWSGAALWLLAPLGLDALLALATRRGIPERLTATRLSARPTAKVEAPAEAPASGA